MRRLNFLLAAILLSFTNIYTQQSDPKEDATNGEDTLKVYQMPSVSVTTTRAEERRSPVPFNEITEAEIEKQHTTHDIPLLLNSMPSIVATSQSGNFVGYSSINMRGFGQRRISVMVNGIPQNDPEDHNMYWINLADLTSSLNKTQVQRGAGMSNYGAAAIGGSINLVTKNFAKERGVKVYSGVGYQQFGAESKDDLKATMSKFALEANSGLIDGKYAVYGRLSRINSWGYRDHSQTFMNGYYLSAVRFDEDFSTQINVFGGRQNDGLVYNGIPKEWNDDPEKRLSNYSYWDYNHSTDDPEDIVSWSAKRRKIAWEDFQQPHYEILNDWHINDNLELKSSLFYYTGKGYFDYSGAGWTDSTTFSISKNPKNTVIRAWVGNKQGGWIPRLIWEGEKHHTMIGAEMRIHRSDHWGKINYATNLPEDYDPNYKFYEYGGERDIFSIFFREQYQITPKLLLNAEGQLVRHTYIINNETLGGEETEYPTVGGGMNGNGGDIFNVNYLFFNPRFGANYNINEEMNVYSSIAYTSREPRMTNLYNASEHATGGATPLFEVDTSGGVKRYNFDEPLVKPESLLDIELGYSYEDPNYFFNANFYWMDFYDELVKSGQLDVFGLPIDGNAPRTRHYGIELQGTAAILKSMDYGILKIGGNFTYSQNNILEHNYLTSGGESISLEGNSIAGFPDVMGNLMLSYNYKDLYLMISAKHVGEFRTDNFGDLLTSVPRLENDLGGGYYTDNTVDPYTVMNAKINYTFNNLFGLRSLKLEGHIINLTNKLYMQSGEGKEFFPAGERQFFLGIQMGI